MVNREITLIEFLDNYILTEKSSNENEGIDNYYFNELPIYEKNQKRKELFESLILRINLLFDMNWSLEQYYEEGFVYKESGDTNKRTKVITETESENEYALSSNLKLVPPIKKLTPIEQILYELLLNDLDKNINGIAIIYSIKQFDWRPVPEEIRDKLKKIIECLMDYNIDLFGDLTVCDNLLSNAIFKLENPKEYFFNRSLQAVLEAPEIINIFSKGLRKSYEIEIDDYLNKRKKYLDVIEKKLTELIIYHNRVLNKLKNSYYKESKELKKCEKKLLKNNNNTDLQREIIKHQNNLSSPEEPFEEMIVLLEKNLNEENTY